MKKIITWVLIINLAVVFIGCSGENKKDNKIIIEVPDEDSKTNPKDKDALVVGSIMKFEEDKVHIISGDIVDIYDYNGFNKEFYLGQEVQLIKSEDGNYLKKLDKDDYSMTHTNMGDKIDIISGSVESFDKSKIVVNTGLDKISVQYFDEYLELETNEEVEIYAIKSYENNKYRSLFVLQNNSKIELSIECLERGKEGELIATLIDANGGEYTINFSNITTEFDIAELKVKDKIIVYYKAIMESYPMQLDILLARK